MTAELKLTDDLRTRDLRTRDLRTRDLRTRELKLASDVTSIAAQIKTLKAEYDEELVWGVRWDDAGLRVGHIFPESRAWADGEMTEETVGGTSTIQDKCLRCVTVFNFYIGTPYIVAGYHAGYGEDDGEIIMRECEIMAEVN